jgi:AraC-like DNA-binding protein
MRARFEKIPSDPNRSFRCVERRIAQFDAPWHFHPEIELTLIEASSGRRFVGDSIEPFAPGDLVLLGSNLPHFWQNEPDVGPVTKIPARALVVQFRDDFLGVEVWRKPEFAAIRRLLARAARGLHFSGPAARTAAADLRTLPRRTGLPALLRLLGVLETLAAARSVRPLASVSYAPVLDRRAEARLARVYAFAATHFRETVTLPQLARAAAMSPAAFSRYFKRSTGRAPSDFINDLRIEHACRLLRETDRTVTDIAADAGFPTLTNFNRRFRERTKATPRDYRRAFAEQSIPGRFVVT